MKNIQRSSACKFFITFVLSMISLSLMTGNVYARDDFPDIGTNAQINDAVQLIWQIRKTKRWDDSLNNEEASAVNLALDIHEQILITTYFGIANTSIRFIASKLSSAGQRALLEGVTARVTSSSNTTPYLDPEKKQIIVPVGFLRALSETNWAEYESTRVPSLEMKFVEFTTLKLVTGYERSKQPKANSVLRLSEFSGQKVWQPSHDETIKGEKFVDLAIRESLLFAVAHEVCHILNSDKHYRSIQSMEAIKQEWRADECARPLADTAWGSAVDPSKMYFVLIFSSFDQAGNFKPSTTHPPALCRAFGDVMSIVKKNGDARTPMELFDEMMRTDFVKRRLPDKNNGYPDIDAKKISEKTSRIMREVCGFK